MAYLLPKFLGTISEQSKIKGVTIIEVIIGMELSKSGIEVKLLAKNKVANAAQLVLATLLPIKIAERAVSELAINWST